jgi:hypothetical protein
MTNRKEMPKETFSKKLKRGGKAVPHKEIMSSKSNGVL